MFIYIEEQSLTLSILIPGVKPCSINKAYYARNKVLTKDAREYREAFLQCINNCTSNQDLMKAFKAAFDPKKHVLSTELTFFIPEDVFYTKAGEVSMRSGDVDNYIKLTNDFLMNDKYYDDPYRLEKGDCYNIGVDDRFVTDTILKKRPAHDWAIQIKISIKSIVDTAQDVETLNTEGDWVVVL